MASAGPRVAKFVELLEIADLNPEVLDQQEKVLASRARLTLSLFVKAMSELSERLTFAHPCQTVDSKPRPHGRPIC